MQQETTFSPTKAAPARRRARRTPNGRRALRLLAPVMTLSLILAAWQLVAALEIYPRFIVPLPVDVWDKFYAVTLGDGRVSLWEHVVVTMNEVLLGLAVGLGLAVVLGYWIAKQPLLEDLLSPVVVGFQATPVVAYAPLLVIWFGSGVTSKVITSALIVFFPMLMNTIVGVRSVPNALHDLMRALNATPLQMLTKLEVPAALPVLIGGLKVSATLAVIGAVVGEFVSSSAGLGFLINLARSQYDTPLVIVAVLTLTALALALYGLVMVLEHYALRWRKHNP